MARMNFQPTFQLDGDEEFIRNLRRVQGVHIDDAIEKGLKATSRTIPGYMAAAMAKHYTPKSGVLKPLIQRPYTQGNELIIKTSAKPISARHFKPLNGIRHQNKKGASISILKGQRTARKDAFRNPGARFPKTMSMGTPFVRKGSRLPIEKMNTVSFHHAFTGGAKARPMLEHVEQKSKHKLEQSVIRALRAKAKGFIE